MKANIIALTAALLVTGVATAQGTASASMSTPPSAGDPHMCLAKTDEAAMKSLLFSADQITRVKAIQEACKKECAGMTSEDKAKKEANVTSKHESDLKAVLTPDQYANWQKWCASKDAPAGKADPKK